MDWIQCFLMKQIFSNYFHAMHVLFNVFSVTSCKGERKVWRTQMHNVVKIVI